MNQLGELLRQSRETQGITLKELQSRTKIRIRYLEAIEAGEFSVIPGEVYLRGFIRAVAKELGIDQQEAMDTYYRQIQPSDDQPEVATGDALQTNSRPVVPVAPPPEIPAPRVPQPPISAPVRRPAANRSRKKKARRMKSSQAAPRWLLLLLLLGIIAAAVFLWDRLGEQLPPENPDPQGPEEPVPNPEPPPPQIQVELQNPGEPNPVYLVHPGPLTVILTAETAPCWVGASADGGPQQQETLNPSGRIASITLEAENSLQVRIGNPAGLRLVINGIDQGIIGGDRPIDLTVELNTTAE